MCTLSIVPYYDYNALFIAFNRDEQKNRKIALPPEYYHFNSIKMLYPRDQQSGGTWIGINSLGFIFFLLNYNQKNLYKNFFINPAYKNKKSRGLIIPELLKSKSENEVIKKIYKLDYLNYSPFRLIFFHLKNYTVFQFIYTGRGIKVRQHKLPFFQASSGLGDHKIYPLRKKLFKFFLENNPTIRKQIKFHHYVDKNNPLASIKINRILAQTVSQTFILIQNQKIILHYYDLIKTQKNKYYLELDALDHYS